MKKYCLLLCLCAGVAQGSVINVTCGEGTIQSAVDKARPGDEVVIGPGVYFESVKIGCRGTEDHPIVIRADKVAPNRVIVSGADRAVREGRVKWTLEDEALALYSIIWTNPAPTRVLYGQADLYPYRDLSRLKAFMAVPEHNHIGPQHGYAVDLKEKKLYVRLHPSGKYGPTDPNRQTMCISGPLGKGPVGLEVTRPSDYGFGLFGKGSAHVEIRGITFETPGQTGVYVESDDVRVSDCRFVGCRGGVTGNAPYFLPKDYDYASSAKRVSVTYCEFTQFPTYDDGMETIRLAREAGLPMTFWARKDYQSGLRDQALNYETGIACLMGDDWEVAHCRVWNAFEALSSRATTTSRNARVHDNVFEQLLDNAVEAEDHSVALEVRRNVVRDVFGPFSWQPLENEPWPVGFVCSENVVYSTPEHEKAFAFRNPCVFKIGATGAKRTYGKEYVPVLPEPGILMERNTVLWGAGCLFWAAVWGNNPDKVTLKDNIIYTEMNMPVGWQGRFDFLRLDGNIFVQRAVNGLEDQTVNALDLLKLKERDGLALIPAKGSPAEGKGALSESSTWYPPKAGLRVH